MSPLRQFLHDFAGSRLALIGLLFLLAVLAAALLAPWLAPQNPYDLGALDIADGRLPPGEAASAGFTFWLGSDDQGRDMLSAILYGLRTSLGVGVASTLFALALGTLLGLLAAYAGGWVDGLVMRVVDIQLSFPAILVALILLAVLGKGVDKIVLALAAVQWAFYARTVRSAAMVERRKEYIEAARCLSLGHRTIMLGHLLPNCVAPLIVVATVQVAHAIALEATLSFLGLGLPITEPSLGLLIANGFQYLLSGKSWISVYPGVALVVTIVAINLVADQLRDVLNPRLQK
ncbi:ABC transporter permease [Azospirillum sp. sgz301742]